MNFSTHAVTTRDGVRIAFNHYQAAAGRSAVIVCPGFFKGKDSRDFRGLAERLLDVCDVLAMDFRGHGHSGGRYTFSAREAGDLEAVLGWAQPQYARIALMGFSLGGAIAINTASRRPAGVRSVITVGAPSDFRRIENRFWTRRAIGAAIQGFGRGSGCRPGNLFLPKERPVDSISRLKDLPILLIHGEEDPIVGVGHGHRLYEAAGDPKQLWVVHRGGHAEALIREQPDAFSDLVREWLDRTLA